MMEAERARAERLCRLFGLTEHDAHDEHERAAGRHALPSAADFSRAVAARMDALGVAELSGPPAEDDDGEEDPAAFAWWLLRMAETTYAQLVTPPSPAREPAPEPARAVDPALLARFEALLVGRPRRDVEHAQLHIDAASALRRAQAIDARAPAGRVLAVGDDDAVTVALALLGRRALAAVDIDPRVLAFVRDACREVSADVDLETHEVDLFRDAIPPSLRRACVAAVADPIRSGDASIQFLLFGIASLVRAPSSRLFFCDHPDWSFEHDAVVDALETAGWIEREVVENLHRYPLSLDVFPRRTRTAMAVGLDAAWLDALIGATDAWSHLYVLAMG